MKGKVETNEPTYWERMKANGRVQVIQNKRKFYSDGIIGFFLLGICIWITLWLFKLLFYSVIPAIGSFKLSFTLSPQLTTTADSVASFFNLSLFWTDVFFLVSFLSIFTGSIYFTLKSNLKSKRFKFLFVFMPCVSFIYITKLFNLNFITVELYLLFFVCLSLNILISFFINSNLTISRFCFTKSDLLSLITFFPSLLIVLQLEYFQLHEFFKISLLLIFFLSLGNTFYFAYKRFIYREFISISSVIDQKLLHSEGMVTEQDASFDYLIAMNLKGSVGVWLMGVMGVGTNLTKANKFNHGLFDLAHNQVYIKDNNDKAFNYITYSIIATIIITLGFNFISVCYIFIYMNILKIYKSLFKTKLNEFNTSITGELISYKKDIYANFINRVFPKKIGSIFDSKKSNYGIIFHHADNYIVNGKLLNWNVIQKDVYHSILIDTKTTGPDHARFILESDFYSNLKRVDIVIEGFKNNSEAIIVGKYDIAISNLENNWIDKRMGLIKRLVDEKFIDVIDFKKTRNHINQFASTESLRINIILFQEHYHEFYLKMISELNGKGIFEINTLVRQVHESASIPSRFIDNLNIAEVIIRYLVGFLHARHQNSDYQLNKYAYETKAISFGGALSYLSQFRKNHIPNSILEKRIQSYLAIQYADVENIESLRKYMIDLGWTERLTTKPDIELLFWWISNIRNKTRGHGTPSKVDFEFYVCIQKIILFVVHEFSKLGIEMYVRACIEDQKWIINYSKGGLPVLFPDEIEIDRKVHFNIYMPDDEIDSIIKIATITKQHVPENSQVPYIKLEEDNKVEWWKCENHFFEKDGIIYLINQRSEKKENWISFTTGDIIRPTSINSEFNS